MTPLGADPPSGVGDGVLHQLGPASLAKPGPLCNGSEPDRLGFEE